MSASTSRFALRLGAIVAVSSLIFFATALQAIAQLSDELQISTPAGLAFDSLIPEGAPAGQEPESIWDPTGTLGIGASGLVPAGELTGLGLITPGLPNLAGVFYVILSEAPGTPADPGELPPVTYMTPNGPVVVSDVLLNGLNSLAFQAGQFPPLIALLSDNNPDLTNLVAQLPAGIPVIQETGGLQDLTALMGPNILPLNGAPIDVAVRSDVSTPEPSTFVLAGLGGLALLARRWRRR